MPLLGQRAGAARLNAQRRGGSFWILGYTRSQSVSFANGSRSCKIGSEGFSTGLELGWAGGEGEDEGGGEECRERKAQSEKRKAERREKLDGGGNARMAKSVSRCCRGCGCECGSGCGQNGGIGRAQRGQRQTASQTARQTARQPDEQRWTHSQVNSQEGV